MPGKKCEFKGCNELATHNYKNMRPVLCVLHMLAGMIWTFSARCVCGKQTSFGFPDDDWKTCCSVCKKPGMEDKRCKKCKCGKSRPTYGLPDDKQATCCAKCKTPDMVDLKHHKCKCKKARPSFGIPGEKATCCKDCKSSEMVDVVTKNFCKCMKHPVFGFPDDEKATCCKNCAEPGMVNIQDVIKCKCGKSRPSFGMPSDEKPTCCKGCKSPEMVNIVSKLCKCGKRPSFGNPGDSSPTCCKDCKLPNMVDLVHKKCACGKNPSFGNPGDLRPTCCNDCKSHSMVQLVSIKCGCGGIAYYGVSKDLPPTHCGDCKSVDMVNVVRKLCKCGKSQPNFGMPGDLRPTCCCGCILPGMINLVQKNCTSDWCDSRGRYKNEEDGNYYCIDCLLSIKPDDSRLRTCVRKEFYVLAELERRLPWLQESAVKVVWDSGIAAATNDLISDENFVLKYTPGSCVGFRPDLLCDFGSYVLVIEIDENQHLRNCVSSEKQKMNSIWEQLGNKPICFIRFNPDEYIDDDGVKHASTFKTHRVNSGEKRVRATHAGEFEERMSHLVEVVSHVVENQIEGIQFLYYDSSNMYEADSPDN